MSRSVPGARKRLTVAAVALTFPAGLGWLAVDDAAARPVVDSAPRLSSTVLAQAAAATAPTPQVPTGLKVASVGDGRVDIAWTPSPDLRVGDKYQVYVDDPTVQGEHQGGDDATGTQTTATKFSFTKLPSGKPLVNGRAYTFRVSAGGANRTYSPWSEPGVVGVPAVPAVNVPAVPTGLKVAAVGDGRVDIAWNASPDLRVGDKYQVYVDDPSVQGEHQGGDDATGTQTTDTKFSFTKLP